MDPAVVIDHESEGFWTGLSKREWRLCVCTNCATPRFPPSATCKRCARPGWEWRPASGSGAVYAVTTVHRAPSDFWEAFLPYAVALIDLDEGVRIMCTLLAHDLAQVSEGCRVVLRFRETADGPQPFFTPEKEPVDG